MSMISAQIDELNKSADEWNNSNMFELARMCREAADTIWQLRDDLQLTNAENARLRDELDAVGTAAYLHGRDQLKAENDKLRELVADALLSTKDYAEKHGGPSNAFDASDWRIVHLRSRGRELGVEVDG